MSSELLLNFDKQVSKKNNPLIGTSSTQVEKKGGSSLFDSLMNEVKEDSLEKVVIIKSLNLNEMNLHPKIALIKRMNL